MTILPSPATLDHVRVRGGARLSFAERSGRTYAADVFETGGYRVLLPTLNTMTEAVIINTGGGMAGGDRVGFAIDATPGARAIVTSQAAERIYRSTGPATEIDITLAVAPEATLLWMPQETLLYSGARLSRRLTATMSSSSRLLVSDIVVFGRRAMGETLGSGLFKDSWRISRDGCLTYADAIRLDGDLDPLMARPSVTGGRHVVANLVGLLPDAGDWLEPVRAALAEESAVDAAASSWNGILSVRLIGARLEDVRGALARALLQLKLAPLPRVWST